MQKSSLMTFATELSVDEVMKRIEKILEEKEITIFARINHSKAAHEVGLAMQDEALLIFGNPKVGTALMIESPDIGIELPLKIIAWQENQQTIVGIQNVERLSMEYAIPKSNDTIKLFKQFLIDLVESAIVSAQSTPSIS
jgi:uncharacterized protein (DUF302 family)